ncbi:MAG: ABC transporter permease [Gemmatimonadota bacterium]|nr:ABC transporter permease [Gemmatimonadota bacterium]
MTQSLLAAVRRLLRARAFALAALLTLALGIGATTAAFTVVRGVLIRPLPFERSDRLVDLTHMIVISGASRIDQSDATYLLYRRDNRTFADMGVYREVAANVAPVVGPARADARPERVPAAVMTASVFRTLRVAPIRGRIFSTADETPGAPPSVLVGEEMWRHQLGADPSIVGSRIVVDGVPRTIVGVMPASFAFPANESALWLPLALDAARTSSATFDLHGIGRLKDGVSIAAAAADLQRLLPHVPEVFPGRLTAPSIEAIHMRTDVRPLRDVVVGDVGHILWIVLAAVAFLLLIACANVANLFLARAEGRQHEIAVRMALGAGRSDVMMEFLSEAAVLAPIAAVAGLALALAGVQLLESFGAATSIPRLSEVGVDLDVLAVVAGLAVMSALIVSLAPLARLRRMSPLAALGDAGRSSTTGRVRHRARRAFVVAQVALSLMLLAGATLAARSFARLRSIQPGFSAERALVMRVAIPEASYAKAGDASRLVDQLLDGMRGIPRVTDAGAITKLPLDIIGRRDSALFVEDRPLVPGSMPNLHQVVYVTPGYFRAMGIPLVGGRPLEPPETDRDPLQARHEVMLSASVAKRYWPSESPIGKRVRTLPTGPWYTVVGVVGDVPDAALEQPKAELVYLPLVTSTAAGTPWMPRDIALVARGAADPASIASSVRAVVRKVDASLPLYRLMPASELSAKATSRAAFTLTLLGVAATMALAIAATGIYGVISYLTSLRRREIGVRLALGARPADVLRLVTQQALRDALIGVAVGIGGAAAITRVLSAILFDVSPFDLPSLAVPSVALLAVTLLASWLPARRAAASDPASVLRSE